MFIGNFANLFFHCVNLTGYQTLHPSRVVGPMTVALTINQRLSREVTLQLVNDAHIIPSDVVLFNHPDSDGTLTISGGMLMCPHGRSNSIEIITRTV